MLGEDDSMPPKRGKKKTKTKAGGKKKAARGDAEGSVAAGYDSDDSVASNASDVSLFAVAREQIEQGAAAYLKEDTADKVDTVRDISGMFEEIFEQLSEKRYTTREKALNQLLVLLSSGLRAEELEHNLETLLYTLCSCAKRGKTKESALASRNVALVSISLGAERDDVFSAVEAALLHVSARGKGDLAKAEAIKALALCCFVSATEESASLKTLNTLLAIFAGSSVGAGAVSMKKAPGAPVLAAAISGWALLATTMPRSMFSSSAFDAYTSKLQPMLYHDSLSVRAAAGEAIALLHEMNGGPRRLSQDLREDAEAEFAEHDGGEEDDEEDEDDDDEDEAVDSVPALEFDEDEDVASAVQRLATGYNRYKSKRERKEQRFLFRDVFRTVVNGEKPDRSLTIAGENLVFDSWVELARLGMLRGALTSGFQIHFAENTLIRDIFGLGERREMPVKLSSLEKRKYMSKNSVASKELTLDRKFDRNARNNMKNAFLNSD